MKNKKNINKYKRATTDDESQTRLVTAEYFKMHFIYIDEKAKTARCNGEVYKILMHGPTLVRMVKQV